MVISLRDNGGRLWSSFEFSLKYPKWGAHNGCYKKKSDVPNAKKRSVVANLPELFEAYVQMPSVKDCQTKMLLGYISVVIAMR